jgi:hypothetical protein
VRRIVDWADEPGSPDRRLIYKVEAGADRRTSGVDSVNGFARWAKYEVIRDEDNWRRVLEQDE